MKLTCNIWYLHFLRFSFLPIYGLWKFLSIFDFLWFNGDAGWKHMKCMYIICIINQTVSSSHYYYLSYPHLTSSLACGVTYIEWKYKIFLSMRRWRSKKYKEYDIIPLSYQTSNSGRGSCPTDKTHYFKIWDLSSKRHFNMLPSHFSHFCIQYVFVNSIQTVWNNNTTRKKNLRWILQVSLYILYELWSYEY